MEQQQLNLTKLKQITLTAQHNFVHNTANSFISLLYQIDTNTEWIKSHHIIAHTQIKCTLTTKKNTRVHRLLSNTLTGKRTSFFVGFSVCGLWETGILRQLFTTVPSTLLPQWRCSLQHLSLVVCWLQNVWRKYATVLNLHHGS